MDIFPAIDLKNGACVRLRQGDFEESTVYETDPQAVVKDFEAQGATWLHVVDLDGAREGAARQGLIMTRLAAATRLKIQAGGGVRSETDIENLLQAGVARVIVGSVAVKDPQKVLGWMRRFGGAKIVLALDVRMEGGEPEVLTRGWQERSGQSLWDVLARFADERPGAVLCTDIARDGMLTGPNVALYAEMQKRFSGLEILASGGVGSLDDIKALAALNLAGVITGKALYEKKFTLAQALTYAC